MKTIYRFTIILLFTIFFHFAAQANSVIYNMYNREGYNVNVTIQTLQSTVSVNNGRVIVPISVSRADVANSGYVVFELRNNGRSAELACQILKDARGRYYLMAESLYQVNGLADGNYSVILKSQR